MVENSPSLSKGSHQIICSDQSWVVNIEVTKGVAHNFLVKLHLRGERSHQELCVVNLAFASVVGVTNNLVNFLLCNIPAQIVKNLLDHLECQEPRIILIKDNKGFFKLFYVLVLHMFDYHT